MSAATDPLCGLIPPAEIEALERFIEEIGNGAVARRIAATAAWDRIWEQRQHEIEEEQ